MAETDRRAVAQTDLEVFPLCLGGNVFGWTADQERSFEILDAYTVVGGNFVDTADSYDYEMGNGLEIVLRSV